MTTTADNPQKPLVSLSIPEDRPLNERELKDALLALAGGINQLGTDINKLGDDVKEIKSELKDWMGWLRVVSVDIRIIKPRKP